MDPALAALDFAKAGAILADMIASCLAAGALPFDPEGPDDHDLEDRRSTPVEAGLPIRSPVDAGAGPLEPGEHGPPIQSVEQGPIARLEDRADPGPRPRSDRKSTRLNSSHFGISHAVFCLNNKKIYNEGVATVMISYVRRLISIEAHA